MEYTRIYLVNFDQTENVCISGDLICFAQQAVWMTLIVRDDDDVGDDDDGFKVASDYFDLNPA